MIARLRRLDRRAWLSLLGLLALAALLRLPSLATRGTWDSDQGHDMLVLRTFVREGVVPLLGPPTSIGDVHHGAWYYYLLTPAAFLTGGDSPLAVVAVIALAGIAAVGVTWWLARSIGGPLAGLVAGLAMAVSAAAVDESTFIWNPNLIALSSAVALAGAWRAWSTRRPGWWLVAAIGAAITMQCHVLGVALLPVVGALLVADARRGRRRDPGRVGAGDPGGAGAREGESVGVGAGVGTGLGRGTIAGVAAILAVSLAPLLVNELTTGWSEVRAALDYLAGGSSEADAGLLVRIGIAGLRVVSWPLTGLITAGFVAGVLATIAIVGIAAWRWRAPAPERTAIRWLALGLLWSTLFLAVAAPSLATVVPGLPNDHYHAFADPMVFTLAGLGAAALARFVPGRVIAGLALLALVGWNVGRLPAAVHPDGGFPAAERAAARVASALTAAGVDDDTIVRIRSLPAFKSTESMAYPLVRLGRAVAAHTPDGLAPGSTDPATSGQAGPFALVLLCDSLFEASIGAPCGGAAEAVVEGGGGMGRLLDRAEVAPGRWVSVYGAP